MNTSLRFTSEANGGYRPTAMLIGLLPSFITWLLPFLSLFLFFRLPLPVQLLSFFSNFRVRNYLFYIVYSEKDSWMGILYKYTRKELVYPSIVLLVF